MSKIRAELTIESDGRRTTMIDCEVEWDRSRGQWRAFNGEGYEAWAETKNGAILAVFAKHLGITPRGALIVGNEAERFFVDDPDAALIDRERIETLRRDLSDAGDRHDSIRCDEIAAELLKLGGWT